MVKYHMPLKGSKNLLLNIFLLYLSFSFLSQKKLLQK